MDSLGDFSRASQEVAGPVSPFPPPPLPWHQQAQLLLILGTTSDTGRKVLFWNLGWRRTLTSEDLPYAMQLIQTGSFPIPIAGRTWALFSGSLFTNLFVGKKKKKKLNHTNDQFAYRMISNNNPFIHEMVLISPVSGLPNQCSELNPWNQREEFLKNEPNVAESSIALLASRNPPENDTCGFKTYKEN